MATCENAEAELGMLKTEKASHRCEVYYMKETRSDRLVMRIVGSPMRFFGVVLFFFVFCCFCLFFFPTICLMFSDGSFPYVSDKRLRISICAVFLVYFYS